MRSAAWPRSTRPSPARDSSRRMRLDGFIDMIGRPAPPGIYTLLRMGTIAPPERSKCSEPSGTWAVAPSARLSTPSHKYGCIRSSDGPQRGRSVRPSRSGLLAIDASTPTALGSLRHIAEDMAQSRALPAARLVPLCATPYLREGVLGSAPSLLAVV